jgi:hypothetical protein
MMNRKLPAAAALQWVVSAACLLTCAISPLHAEDFPDPTRPPASIFAPVAGAGAGREAKADHSVGLHTVIISKTRRAAIIDGKTVELWGQHGNARLIEVNEGGVVLQRAKGRQVLTLFPGVKITRKVIPEQEPAKTKLPDEKSQGIQPLPANDMQSGEEESKPIAHYEKLLSGHPKEEK